MLSAIAQPAVKRTVSTMILKGIDKETKPPKRVNERYCRVDLFIRKFYLSFALLSQVGEFLNACKIGANYVCAFLGKRIKITFWFRFQACSLLNLL